MMSLYDSLTCVSDTVIHVGRQDHIEGGEGEWANGALLDRR